MSQDDPEHTEYTDTIQSCQITVWSSCLDGQKFPTIGQSRKTHQETLEPFCEKQENYVFVKSNSDFSTNLQSRLQREP